MTLWDDLNARARGLSTHLLGRATLEHLAGATDLVTVAAELQRRGYMVDDAARASPTGLELAVRRASGARLLLLTRWAGPRSAVLAVLFEDEDRRSIASLIRGAIAGAPAEHRLSGLVPTAELPLRALEELARQPSPRAIASVLMAWGHPLAAALSLNTMGPEPDPLRMEIGLTRAFASHALAAARRTGRRGLLVRYAQQVVDILNAYATLVLSEDKESRIVDHWIPGGRAVTLALAQHALASQEASAASRILAKGFSGTRLAAAFAHPDLHPAGVEAAVLAAQIAELGTLARTWPLSPAPFLGYALRLRAEVLDVRRLIWGISLRAPGLALVERLVTTA